MTTHLGELKQVSLRVADLQEAVAFYQGTLQLPLTATFGGLAFFNLGGVRLMVSEGGAVSGANSVLYLAVDDIEAARSSLEDRGVTFVDTPHPIFEDAEGLFGPRGQTEWMTFFEDPERNLLALWERRPRHLSPEAV